jgi:hypothetical protein
VSEAVLVRQVFDQSIPGHDDKCKFGFIASPSRWHNFPMLFQPARASSGDLGAPANL